MPDCGIVFITFCDRHRLHWAPLVGRRYKLHLLEHEGQRQDSCVPLNDRAPHHRRAKRDGAAVLDARSLYLQHHVLEGVKLEEPVHNTVVAKAYGIPIGALHWPRHYGSMPNPTSHPPQDRIREDSPGAKPERPPAPDEEAVLREEIGKMPPGPERRRVIGSPFAFDQALLDGDADQN